MTRWGMLADLERCVGCQTCTAACRHANATSPAVQWRRVLDIESGTYPAVTRTFVPVGCQHCADPPCMHVCPTTATRQRADGIVTVDYDLCIGCAYCEVACPYQARFLDRRPHFAYGAAMRNEAERADARRSGVAQKCTFCSDRIDLGLAKGLTPGLDPDATPACVNACIADALHFGDLDDPDSNVSRLLGEQRHFRMHEELGTAPGFHYLYGSAAQDDGPVRDAAAQPAERLRTRGVEPVHQAHWDWKAAGNFICGGAGSGLYACIALAAIPEPALYRLGWLALALVALGLFLVLLKIGRPLRAIYVLRQPRRSWMAREAWLAAGFLPLAAAATWLRHPGLSLAAALLGLLFLCSQAMILREAKGIPAWRVPSILPLMVVTGLAEGAGLLLAAVAVLAPPAGLAAASAALAIALGAVRAFCWRTYVKDLAARGAPTRTLAVLRAANPWFLAGSIALPLALVGAALAVPPAAAAALVLSGLLLAGAGGALKFVLLTRAGFNQGFALEHVPMRGSGATGPAVKPGWLPPRGAFEGGFDHEHA